MEKYGYKIFDKGLVNRYGTKFELNKIYNILDGEVKWGNDGNGFHFCENLEDTLRYGNAMEGETDICYVRGSGKILEYEDDYNDYYDMYVASSIEILKILPREEIIGSMLSGGFLSQRRFVMGYKLTEEEIEKFLVMRPELFDTIEYYQRNNKDAFSKGK